VSLQRGERLGMWTDCGNSRALRCVRTFSPGRALHNESFLAANDPSLIKSSQLCPLVSCYLVSYKNRGGKRVSAKSDYMELAISYRTQRFCHLATTKLPTRTNSNVAFQYFTIQFVSVKPLLSHFVCTGFLLHLMTHN
jgi:hypothetical protein